MHILIATPYLPWPLTEGGRVAQFRTFEALRNDCVFTLVVPVYSLEEETDARTFAGLFPNLKVKAVRCFQIVPPPTLRSRVKNLAGQLRRSFSAPLPEIKKIEEPVPDYPFHRLNPDFVAAVEEEFTKGCDIFQAEFANMATLGPLMSGRVPSVFVNHQLHFVYARRFLEANVGCGVNAQYITERIVFEEPAYLKTFDTTVVFSEVDQKSLVVLCPQLQINVSPFPSPEDADAAPTPFNNWVTRFTFVASASHRPNVDGLNWFMEKVWPVIKSRMPDASMEVIGQWPATAQASLPNHEDIRFAGFVPELKEALRHKIMIVPVLVGSGIRTKILAAWSSSCPVVTTAVGVEGLPGQDGEHFIIADDAAVFASNCIELSQDINKLNRIATNGLALVKEHYSLKAVRRTRLNIYNKLLAIQRRPAS
jgi:polysaccharide biosynthesis protein PslH